LSSHRLILFDDAQARSWAPFSLTRPIGELLYGSMTLRARAERVLGIDCAGHITSPSLASFDEQGAPGTLTPDQVNALTGPKVLLSSRCALDFAETAMPPGRARIVVGGRTVGLVLPAGEPFPSDAWILDPETEDDGPDAPRRLALEGENVSSPWDLVRMNPDRLRRDASHLWPDSKHPAGVHLVGDGVLSLGADAVIEPGVVIDLREGPVRLDEGARVEGPARLVGPLHLGRGSIVFGGHVAASSIGPVCKIRGEVADSVLLGYDNKAHDGYLGHALVGRWVNLGALTTNSDLKNNYGSVTVWTPSGPVDTGLMKVGCFLGDHVKTGIGTVLNTGTVVGTGSNVFGGGMPPSFVPPFSWGSGSEYVDYRLDKFLEGAERAMARRDVPLSPGSRAIFERAWSDTASARRAAQSDGR
jgi:UDP-N-acetylglucosamine diphosphorylase / glucose-1-phosphate thymidylyltransferase / UDP-N-acetylgalactosamine diphosphorylase / glucosamine-1-phosphate N-acetyltransferase / galactosamine-1-phosphate N-acetyltransferase